MNFSGCQINERGFFFFCLSSCICCHYCVFTSTRTRQNYSCCFLRRPRSRSWHQGYRCYDPDARCPRILCHIQFNESSHFFPPTNHELSFIIIPPESSSLSGPQLEPPRFGLLPLHLLTLLRPRYTCWVSFSCQVTTSRLHFVSYCRSWVTTSQVSSC